MKHKHKYYIRIAKARNFRSRRANSYTLARRAVEKSWRIAYISRKLKKRQVRASWISNLNAAVHEHGHSYSAFIHGLRLSNIAVNRKMLGELALFEPLSFKCIVDQAIYARYQNDLSRPYFPVADRYAALQWELEKLETEENELKAKVLALKQDESAEVGKDQSEKDEKKLERHAANKRRRAAKKAKVAAVKSAAKPEAEKEASEPKAEKAKA